MGTIRGHIDYSPVSAKTQRQESPKAKRDDKDQGPAYIVVRFSHMDDVDVVKAINQVIKQKGYCWFGKYGQPIAGGSIRAFTKRGKIPLNVMLVRRRVVKGEKAVFAHEYKCTEISEKQPAQGTYPAYYEQYKHRISTWMKLVPCAGSQVPLEDLITVSSGLPVTHSLSSSLRGHFLCRLRKGD